MCPNCQADVLLLHVGHEPLQQALRYGTACSPPEPLGSHTIPGKLQFSLKTAKSSRFIFQLLVLHKQHFLPVCKCNWSAGLLSTLPRKPLDMHRLHWHWAEATLHFSFAAERLQRAILFCFRIHIRQLTSIDKNSKAKNNSGITTTASKCSLFEC